MIEHLESSYNPSILGSLHFSSIIIEIPKLVECYFDQHTKTEFILFSPHASGLASDMCGLVRDTSGSVWSKMLQDWWMMH